MRRETILNLILAALLLAAPLAALGMGEPYYANLASRAAILALAGVGLNLALGFGGMISFGHAAFFGIGGYVAGISAQAAFNQAAVIAWPVTVMGSDAMPPIWLAAMAVAGLAAIPIGAISLRTSGVYFIMITLAFAQMIYYFAISWPEYGGEDGLSIYVRNGFAGLDTYDPLQFFLICYGCLMLAIGLSWRIMGARFGAALMCARMNPERLATVGIEPFPVKLVAFVISAMITGLAGALFADLNGFVSPAMLGWHTSGEIIVFVILGGVGRLFGPVAGAALYVLMEHVLGGITVHWQLLLGLVLLGVVLFARGGLVGIVAGGARHG
jgi:branched-chain amino acid transport system permease protein